MARTFQNHHLSWSVLLLLLAAVEGLSQQPLLYYCGDADHAYLWVDPGAQAIAVSRQDDHWTTPPDTIQKQLGEIKPGPPDAAIQFLCQAQPDTQSAHPRYPDREIYLRKQPDGTLRLSFITPSNSPTFSFGRGDKVNIPLAKLLNQPNDTDAATVLNRGTKPDMKTFWTSWIDGVLQSNQPVQRVYLDDAQRPLWLWAEAIPESQWINRLRRPMPAPSPVVVEKRIEVPVFDWLRAALFLSLGLVIGGGLIFALRRRRPVLRNDHLLQEIDARLHSLQSDLVSRMELLGKPPGDPQRATDTDLRLKKEASAQIRNLLAPLRTAQTNYLDGFRDPPSSAMLAFLISHSLLHLSLGLLDGDDNSVRAMKANLTSICRKLSPLQIPGFQKTLEQLEKQHWNVEGLTDKMVRADDHRDAGVFQVVLKYLRDYQKLDLAPFYITVDENGLAYRAN